MKAEKSLRLTKQVKAPSVEAATKLRVNVKTRTTQDKMLKDAAPVAVTHDDVLAHNQLTHTYKNRNPVGADVIAPGYLQLHPTQYFNTLDKLRAVIANPDPASVKTWNETASAADLASVPSPIVERFQEIGAKRRDGDKVGLYQFDAEGRTVYQINTWGWGGFKNGLGSGWGQLYTKNAEGQLQELSFLRMAVIAELAMQKGAAVPGLRLDNSTHSENVKPTGGNGFSDVSPND